MVSRTGRNREFSSADVCFNPAGALWTPLPHRFNVPRIKHLWLRPLLAQQLPFSFVTGITGSEFRSSRSSANHAEDF